MSGKREEILDAALAIADARGLAGVSMRAVAQAVGVTPMALYPHVKDKAGLLDAMLGRLLAGVSEAAPELAGAQDWRVRLRAFADTARGLSIGHPWAVTLLFSRPAVTPDAVFTVDQLYGALLDAGVPPSQVPRLERLVSTYVLGWIASESGGRFGPGTPDPRGERGKLPEGGLPAHLALADWLDPPVDWDAEYAADLDDLERLVESVARRGASTAQRAPGTGEDGGGDEDGGGRTAAGG
ncbi:putative TetR family transcriptional regulator [Actinacidiphila reveromycinica]|uniref:Putative TetR family transcriptional regulator n=1 Tax=Actinacidiphila reveromycinica TaxID=659352 RepID=A0A7U3VLB0_9ACTN|nr:TetR/AcrR family transcriptional regulator [Streptomyces sp. SN-593]BBA95359.1 putative TetR family transcriptional regulator [Streptomyces sp. SN-593]